MSERTISELREKKTALEVEIRAAIARFEDECRVGVSGISFRHAQRIGDAFAHVTVVYVDLDIGL